MAVEAKRGCGYRKIGGTYLVGGGIGVPCDRLPILLDVCSCCGQGIKQARGWTWVDVGKLVNGPHVYPAKPANEPLMLPEIPAFECHCTISFGKIMSGIPCDFCHTPEKLGKAGLLWIGEQFYKTPEDFLAEGVALGFSRRIRTIPRGFKPGETYVLLAHPKAYITREPISDLFPNQTEYKEKPGIFYLWLPQRVEKILPESMRDSEDIAELEARGITPVFVPDDDVDHQGSVFDKEEKGE